MPVRQTGTRIRRLREKALIVAPDDIGGMDTLTKDRAAIEALYAKGLGDARAIRSFLE